MAETVFVACKMPNGLRLDVHDQDHPANFETIATLKGTAVAFGMADPTVESGGYSLTEVPADGWAKWLEQNKASDIVKAGWVWAEPNAGRAKAKATEQGEIKGHAPRLSQAEIDAMGVKPAKE